MWILVSGLSVELPPILRIRPKARVIPQSLKVVGLEVEAIAIAIALSLCWVSNET